MCGNFNEITKALKIKWNEVPVFKISKKFSSAENVMSTFIFMNIVNKSVTIVDVVRDIGCIVGEGNNLLLLNLPEMQNPTKPKDNNPYVDSYKRLK